MSRNPHAEAAELRARLRDAHVRLELLAHAVLADPDTAAGLARLLLSDPAGKLTGDGVSQVPPSPFTREPEAGTPFRTERPTHG